VAVHKRPGLAFMEGEAGRRLQDQMRADSLDERLLGWVVNGEERRARQAQAPAKKDLESRRGLWLKKGTYIMIWSFFLRKAKTGYYCSDFLGVISRFPEPVAKGFLLR
jgi:hypothetical protein